MENGVELSGGEWQRVALSRALYKESEIIVLDEPTAAIDPLTEAKLLSSYIDICKGKTSIIVTHRLGCCVYADRIIVLKEGGIIEIGTHNELLQKEGLYSTMFHSQAKNYIDSISKLEVS
ncbi:Lipid A export ATP-binding/permease protein MsbA [compost metagenome]